MARLTRLTRSAAALACFSLFFAGGTLLSLLFLLFPCRRETGLRIVRGQWRLLAGLFRLLRLIRIDRSGLRPAAGRILAANHPSLIDVLLLTVLLPRTFSAAKTPLRDSPFIGRIVRRFFLPGDARLLDEAPPLLRAGYNVLIFPEGTRSPAGGGLHPFKRGAARLSLRTGIPIQPIRIRLSKRILGKGDSPWDMGGEPVLYRFESLPPLSPRLPPGLSAHRAAALLTRRLERLYREEPRRKTEKNERELRERPSAGPRPSGAGLP